MNQPSPRGVASKQKQFLAPVTLSLRHADKTKIGLASTRSPFHGECRKTMRSFFVAIRHELVHEVAA